MKPKKLFITMMLVVILLLAGTIQAYAAEYIYQTTTSVNLRTAPVDGSIIFTMPYSTVVWKKGTSDGWYQVQAWNPNSSQWVTGYCSPAYLDTGIMAQNVSGGQKYLYYYSGGWKDSLKRLPANAFIYYRSSQYGPNLHMYSYGLLNNSDYTYFNWYELNGIVTQSPYPNGYIYGGYRVSSPSYYDLYWG